MRDIQCQWDRIVLAGIVILLVLVLSAPADTPLLTNLSNVSVQNNSTVTAAPTTSLTVMTPATVPAGMGSIIPVNTNSLSPLSNGSILLHSPPVLLLNTPDVQGMTVSINGIASAGLPSDSILNVTWNWGDNDIPELHGFPATHTYASEGTYRIQVSANQSDGQYIRREVSVNISSPMITPAPPVSFPGTKASLIPPPPVSTPAVTLFSPEIDHFNVTINGYTDPGISNETVRMLTIDWGDGSSGNYTTLPGTHTYGSPGLYTVNITAYRSDGEKAMRSITFDVQNATPEPAGPPPGSDSSVSGLLVLVVIILSVIVFGGLAIRIFRGKNDETTTELPKSVAILAEEYHRAKERGDMKVAQDTAAECANLLRTLAEVTPDHRVLYLEKAAFWETIATNIDRNVGIREEGTFPNDKYQVIPLTSEEYDRICSGTDVQPEVLEATLRVGLEIAHEGREGKAVGTSFIVGDTPAVMVNSKQFILNPFFGHQEAERMITDTSTHENVKEFAQLDGAFIINGDGLVEAAGRNITVDTSLVKIPRGMGARHASVAGMTLVTRSIGVVVSQSGGRVAIIKNGKIIRTL